MFTFCIQKDTIKVEPRDFDKEPAEAIREEIHRRYANKVIPNVGLCISLLDILSSTEGAVLYGDGCFYYKCEFRLIIFRPYIGEAILGKVKSQSPEGIVVTVGFFDDILIPPNLLPDYSAFDHDRRAFFWLPSDGTEPHRPTIKDLLSSPEDSKLFIGRKDWIRIRVEEEHWDDTSPTSGKSQPPAAAGAPGVQGEQQQPSVMDTARTNGKPPYSLICSMAEDGTGVLDWWDEEAEE
ncbi:DNA-directed RNA polymerase III complex subunit Rpc25 [Rhodotorula toruloides]|uniref:BY PROTMAP: gi/472584683/gb/EMS22269.1/ DNA-directed RNA polymerase III subunit RPC8 [Rhodosporidium toruloides NP11] gi/647399210/emb/CDR43762.1/ RHTO0S08e05358g1_1 [Rhodosporidium toruloides] n=1 Tax=Rhodotorula toruloides TaxID=5286 RepID=A0A0K3CEX0_RHOTO|nr:DNA-directed RNA polymerase III subunit RPC8 [Rhodotorula toruloides]PRQ75266.1 RNA polymerase III subunit Rpc25-domain containing protein [Rhodotorula toruloides]